MIFIISQELINCRAAEAHLLKMMYKRVQNESYLDDPQRETRLQDGPVLHVPLYLFSPSD